MDEFETEAIVLRCIKMTGGRNLITLLTKDDKKILASAYGGGSSKGGDANILQPMSKSIFQIKQNRYYNVLKVDLIDYPMEIASDIKKLAASMFAIEITDKVIPENSGEYGIYNHLSTFLDSVRRRESGHAIFPIYYLIKILTMTGVFVVNNEVFLDTANESCYFSLKSGKPYGTYEKAKMEIGGAHYDSLILKVSSDIINTVRYLANADISKVDELAIPDDKFNEYWMFLRRYAAYHWGKMNLKSESVLCKTLSKR